MRTNYGMNSIQLTEKKHKIEKSFWNCKLFDVVDVKLCGNFQYNSEKKTTTTFICLRSNKRIIKWNISFNSCNWHVNFSTHTKKNEMKFVMKCCLMENQKKKNNFQRMVYEWKSNDFLGNGGWIIRTGFSATERN